MDIQTYEKEHLELVLKSAGECTVLLKKDGHFPLSKACPIAAYGNGIRHTIKGGTGSGEVNSRFSVNIERGLLDAGFEITTKEWLDEYDEMRVQAKKKYIKEMKAEAKSLHQNVMLYCMGKTMPEPEHDLTLRGDGETAIYVVTRDSGEGNDRLARSGDVLLAQSEIRDILKCNEIYSNFMLVLNVGGVVDLSPVKEVRNILVLSQLGVVTGNVLADILLGRQNPSGKLATTWAKYSDYCTEGTFGDQDDTDYNEGIYVGYRYFDTVGKKALFPFGYGLSYTSFSLDATGIRLDRDIINLTVKVTNSGTFPGREVAQVYVSAPTGHLDKPYQELAAFAKTDEILPGDSQDLNILFSLKDIASYDTDSASYILDAGDYIIRLGNSSIATREIAIVRLQETVKVLQAKNVCGTPKFKDFSPSPIQQSSVPEGLPVLEALAKDLQSENVKYDPEYPISEAISTLSDEELAFMSVGYHDPSKKGFAAVIGNASPHIAGAAGETCSLYTNKGIGYLTMSDGPAGLRLAKNYFVDEKGPHAVGSSMLPESFLDYMNGFTKFLLNAFGLGGAKAPKGAEIKHQYATAIPIGTAIAQSFNQQLATSYGDMVGTEMEMFGINLWLAPALNIHRSILCGRNFEYYSEDPLVSGLIAAAITKGVQKHKGCGTTIKHYAANNQEVNRYCNSSNVSERAMREIYLKGFGICVREAQPHAVMTSYNLLNGVHTSEQKGLIEDILRCEYGYKGIVMTDWVVAGMANNKGRYRTALAGEVAKAGGDVFMPGSKADYDHILSCLADGSLTRKQLEINVSRIYNLVNNI